jgi:hypothetical protein
MEQKTSTQYQLFLQQILPKIQLTRYEMLKSMNKQTVLLNWKIGKSVSEKANCEQWGKSIVEHLTKDLQTELLGILGFSARNIWRMKTFYKTYKENEKRTPLVAEINWMQNYLIKKH